MFLFCAGELPGPGEYHTAPLPAGPAYTIPAAAPDASQAGSAAPGPGEYVGVDAGAGAHGPAYTIPQATLAPDAPAASPGPADYAPAAAAAEGPAFTIAARYAPARPSSLHENALLEEVLVPAV